MDRYPGRQFRPFLNAKYCSDVGYKRRRRGLVPPEAMLDIGAAGRANPWKLDRGVGPIAM